jgi:hypothetical protein
MILLDEDEFRKFSTGRSTLWIKGWTSTPVRDIQLALEQLKFPGDVRGNFSIVWQDIEGNTCLAVDHYSTLPLFYTDTHVSQYFYDIKQHTANLTPNQLVCSMIRFFAGMSVGPGTTYHEILRVEPGHYVMNGSNHCYNDILQLPMIEIDKTAIRTNLMDIVSAYDKCPALLLSGGKDSSTLCGILQHLGIKSKYVSVSSPLQIFSETAIVKKISDYYSIDVIYAEVKNSGMILSDDLNDRFFDFCIDNPFTAKHVAVDNSGLSGHVIMTGEGGCGTYAVRPLLQYAAQRTNLTIRQLCEYMVLDHAFYNKRHSMDLDLIPADCMQAFNYIVDHYVKKWNDSDLSDTHKIVHLNTQDISAFRSYPYSQDRLHSWVHPYFDWRWVSCTIPVDPASKINHRCEKSLYIDCFGDIITTIPWEYPKNGLSIPALSKY